MGSTIPDHHIPWLLLPLPCHNGCRPWIVDVIYIPGRLRQGTSCQGHLTILLADRVGQVHGYLLKARSVNDDEVAHSSTVFKTLSGPIAHQHKL